MASQHQSGNTGTKKIVLSLLMLVLLLTGILLATRFLAPSPVPKPQAIAEPSPDPGAQPKESVKGMKIGTLQFRSTDLQVSTTKDLTFSGGGLIFRVEDVE